MNRGKKRRSHQGFRPVCIFSWNPRAFVYKIFPLKKTYSWEKPLMFLFICNLLLMAFELSAEVESLIFFYYDFSNNINTQVKERSDLLLFYYTGED
jgi:hypothetical protein